MSCDEVGYPMRGALKAAVVAAPMGCLGAGAGRGSRRRHVAASAGLPRGEPSRLGPERGPLGAEVFGYMSELASSAIIGMD